MKKVDLSLFDKNDVEMYRDCGFTDEQIFATLSEEEGINDYDEDVEIEGWVEHLETKGLV
jgi:hypothetical protein